ncbi:error-prone DNA polymerase 2 [Aliidongia dinghuensis]|uniref:Error-prone DNA polymerase n=1 Tax=Aliidongia dinghuensis TaxID=1867774 RepID=A0A8J3E1I1_9PROT|nr:error-prone DNA polymerase [Aliidongia dinghuensis]GGF12164.1 error-prone DNA polymerase 2 [Aliidongia dinghuensis]
MTDYVELTVTSNFTFLEGASHPGELARQAARLGHKAVAITDRNTLGGVVRAWAEAKEVAAEIEVARPKPAPGEGKADGAEEEKEPPFRSIIGCRLDFRDRPSLICLPTDKEAYHRLSRLLTIGKRKAPKGECWLDAADLPAHADGQILIVLPPDEADPGFADWVRKDGEAFAGHCYLAGQHRYHGDDAARLAWLAAVAEDAGTPLVATNDVLYHVPERRVLQDVLACVRMKCTIDEAGRRLEAHAERHLKPGQEMARLFRDYPDALARTIEIADRCRFDMGSLKYEYPDEEGLEGRTVAEELVHRVEAGIRDRYGDDVPPIVREQIDKELKLVAELEYEPYFLTVHDIVRFARELKPPILCQGRGSAANSAICFCLGITEIDPKEGNNLFERFLSHERREPPDIDVDFEHERREEVIQHIYKHYGRHRAALAATVICYRMRAALRDVGKVMGLSADAVAALNGTIWGWSNQGLPEHRVRELGLDPADKRLALTLMLAQELTGFPRHLSQHVGGFVITKGPLGDLVPISNAAMEERTVVEWDKDDLDALRILKIDVLALGMLTCLRKGFDLIRDHFGQCWEIATVPQDVPGVYEMIQRADTIGVFQIESRAQMSMLPRLKPENFYDLVIEIAIVRPGPIQGDMVHPYLRRRRGDEDEPAYPCNEELKPVLHKTLGVPLFQEQAMRIAMVAAEFTGSEADKLRRSMATFRKNGDVDKFKDRMVGRMIERGYDRDFAERCFKQIEGFGDYGFPESHSASFAKLAYVSSWMKWRHPEVFATALLNSQPMGFYQPAQIVRDARVHDVEVRAIDVNHSDWHCTLEAGRARKPLRLGFRLIKGMAEDEAKKLMAARAGGPFRSPEELARRTRVNARTLDCLAKADAFRSMGLDRRAALWAIKGIETDRLPLFAGLDGPLATEAPVVLPAMKPGEHVVADYAATSLSLKRHPVAFLRERLSARGILPTEALGRTRDGRRVTVAGLVLVRQRPGTASGTIFLTLEDETGIANIIVWPAQFERFRRIVMGGALVAVQGRLQREGIVLHLVAEHMVDLSAELHDLDQERALAVPRARADEILHPGEDRRGLRIRSRDFH